MGVLVSPYFNVLFFSFMFPHGFFSFVPRSDWVPSDSISSSSHITLPQSVLPQTRNCNTSQPTYNGGVCSTGSSKGRAFFSRPWNLSGPNLAPRPSSGSRPTPTWNSLQEKGSECPAPKKPVYALLVKWSTLRDRLNGTYVLYFIPREAPLGHKGPVREVPGD